MAVWLWSGQGLFSVFSLGLGEIGKCFLQSALKSFIEYDIISKFLNDKVTCCSVPGQSHLKRDFLVFFLQSSPTKLYMLDLRRLKGGQTTIWITALPFSDYTVACLSVSKSWGYHHHCHHHSHHNHNLHHHYHYQHRHCKEHMLSNMEGGSHNIEECLQHWRLPYTG